MECQTSLTTEKRETIVFALRDAGANDLAFSHGAKTLSTWLRHQFIHTASKKHRGGWAVIPAHCAATFQSLLA